MAKSNNITVHSETLFWGIIYGWEEKEEWIMEDDYATTHWDVLSQGRRKREEEKLRGIKDQGEIDGELF